MSETVPFRFTVGLRISLNTPANRVVKGFIVICYWGQKQPVIRYWGNKTVIVIRYYLETKSVIHDSAENHIL